MKTIFQILVILVVATIIGGAMYVAVNAGGNTTQTRERAFDGEDGEFRPDGDRDDFEGGIMLPFGVVKSLVIVSIIGVPYFAWMKWQVKCKKQTALE